MSFMRATPLAAMSQKRQAELAESGRLVVGSTFARPTAQPRRSVRVSTDPGEDVVQLVLKRALRQIPRFGMISCCEVCGEPLVGELAWQWAVHHRRGREGERTNNSPANLLLVCGRSNVEHCHGDIHSRSTWARALGLLLSRNDNRDPAHQPVCLERQSRWLYLATDGTYSEHPPGFITPAEPVPDGEAT